MKTALVSALLMSCALAAPSCGNRSMLKKINRTLETAYRMPITTDDQPWMMVRGIYAFGLRYVVVDSVTQEKRQALNHLGGTSIAGLVQVDGEGPYFAEKAGERESESRRNFFTAVIAQAGATKETGFLDDYGHFYSMDSFARRAARMLDVRELTADENAVPGRDGNELGWTLIMLANSDLVIAKWDNYRGVLTSTEDILKIAMSRPVGWGEDSGFVEQLGIASALRAYKKYRLEEEMGFYRAKLKNGQKKTLPAPALDSIALDGVWAEAQNHVDGVVETLKKNQIADGSFSSRWSAEKRRADEVEEAVLYTGYALDYLSLALPNNRLEEPWVEKSAGQLCGVIQRNRFQLYEKIWTLSEAAHGLRSYRDRLRDKDKPFVVVPEFESDELPPTAETGRRK